VLLSTCGPLPKGYEGKGKGEKESGRRRIYIDTLEKQDLGVEVEFDFLDSRFFGVDNFVDNEDACIFFLFFVFLFFVFFCFFCFVLFSCFFVIAIRI
jgi:hypothetical protein